MSEDFLKLLLTTGQKTSAKDIDESVSRSAAYFRNGNFSAAIDTIKQVSKQRLHRNDPMIAALYGCILVGVGDINNSNKELKRAISLLPNLAAAFTMFGTAMLLLGRYSEAEQLAYKALLADPPDPEGLHLLVQIYHAIRQHKLNTKDITSPQPVYLKPPLLMSTVMEVEALDNSKTSTEINANDSSKPGIAVDSETPHKETLLTIVLTSYNYAHFIGKAVQSVVNQTSPDWRLMIFDNQSTDNTLEILKPFLIDSRIQLVVRDKNIGAKNNLILGIQSVSTQFVSILQADDYLEDTFVEVAMNQLHQYSKAPFVFFDWRHLMNDTGQFIDHNRHPFSKNRSGPIRIGPYLTICNFVPLHVAAFRTDCLMKYIDFYSVAPLNQVGEQFILKILEDSYGCGCYSGTIGGYWRRHDKQITAEHIAASVDIIEESVERHWYLTKAPNPDFINIFLSLVAFVQISSRVNYIAALNWLMDKGSGYAESFGIPVAKEYDRFQAVALAVALKYSTYTGIVLIEESSLRDWLARMNCQPTFDGLKNRLEQVVEREGETFLNADEISDICYKFFEHEYRNRESNYSAWLAAHFWGYERCRRLLACVELPETLPVIHLLLVVESARQNLLDSTIDDLMAQALANWQLTVVSEHACPDPRFESSPVLEWVQTSLHQVDAIAAVVKASSAEWFFCARAGLHLSPAFTLLSGLYLQARPESLLLYTDEDVINGKGEHSQPKLKPDINSEFLRSSPYVGVATLIRKSLMLDPRVAILPLDLARNYGAALLALEQTQTAVDHLDEILVHVPEALADEYASTALANLLVQQHLARCGIVAELYDAPLPGTLFVDYKLPITPPPMVSIVVLAVDQLHQIQSCLESLLHKTDYPDFEILVIDSGNTEPAVQAFLYALQDRDDRVKILRYLQKYSPPAISNFAACHAKGKLLLLLDNGTMVLQENWLNRLVAIGVRPDVGVVGCRLVSLDQRVKHAGMIIGLGGAVDYISMDLPLAEPGYMGRAQLAQNFSAVAASCMLVRKDLFFEIGGFDEKDFATLYYDADFCLKISDRGYQIIWTPFVTLAQQGNKNFNTENNDKQDKNNSSARKAFIKKWGSRLGHDPAYNRHLSLRQREWMIDGAFDVNWHPDLEPLPRIVAQPPDEMGVGQYRVIGPIKELTNSGKICSYLLPPLNSEKRFLPSIPELIRAKPTTLFLQNAFSDFHLDDLQSYAELLPDLFRVFGQDDIVFSVPQKSAARQHFGKDTKARVRRAISFCHRVIVTNEIMAEALHDMVADIHVVPNYLERFRWGDLKPPRNERRKPRIGWAGAQQHGGDLEFILPVVEATANEVEWIFMGMCPPKLRYHVAEVHNAVPFDQYPAAMAMLDLDLAIAPLELNRFNAAKSNLRLLEYGAVGYPVICTDILPYQNAPVTRVPNNPKAWIEAVRAHAHDLDATRAEGERLREWVLSNWMLDQHLDEWLRALLPG